MFYCIVAAVYRRPHECHLCKQKPKASFKITQESAFAQRRRGKLGEVLQEEGGQRREHSRDPALEVEKTRLEAKTNHVLAFDVFPENSGEAGSESNGLICLKEGILRKGSI